MPYTHHLPIEGSLELDQQGQLDRHHHLRQLRRALESIHDSMYNGYVQALKEDPPGKRKQLALPGFEPIAPNDSDIFKFRKNADLGHLTGRWTGEQ